MRRRIIPDGRRDHPPGRLMVAVGLVVLFVATGAHVGAADEAPNPWIGERVITRYGTVLQVDGKPVNDGGRSKNLADRGKDQAIFRVYKVTRINGPWFWIVAEHSGVKGWVQVGDLIPLDRAVDYYTNQVLADPNDATRYNARGNAHKAMGELDAAIADFTEAIRLNPQSAAAHDNRGSAWRARGDYDKALEDFTEAIRLDPTSVYAHYNRGVVFRARHDYDSAIADFTEAIRLDPKLAHAHRARGGAWYAKGEYAKALTDYDEAIRLDPGYALAHHNRAGVWYAMKEYDKALADYSEAIRLNPKYTTALHNRGVAWYAKKEYDKALEDFNQAIRLDPNLAAAYNNRGNAWADKQEYDKALEDYAAAIRLDPNLAAARFNKVLARLAMGHEDVVADARESIENLQWANDPRPIHAAIAGHLGARRVGQDEAARTFLDDAKANADPTRWPYPIVQFLRREIDEKALLELATDPEKQTEVRCYLAFDQLLNGQTDQARANFQWVRDHGGPGFAGLAAAELAGLDNPASTPNVAAGAEAKPAANPR